MAKSSYLQSRLFHCLVLPLFKKQTKAVGEGTRLQAGRVVGLGKSGGSPELGPVCGRKAAFC